MKDIRGKILISVFDDTTTLGLFVGKERFIYSFSNFLKLQKRDKIKISACSYKKLLFECSKKEVFTGISSFKGYKNDSYPETFFITFESKIFPGIWKITSEDGKIFLTKIR